MPSYPRDEMEDRVERWNVGPNEGFRARGTEQIFGWALGELAEVVGVWRQIAPVKRPDGSNDAVAGAGGPIRQLQGHLAMARIAVFGR